MPTGDSLVRIGSRDAEISLDQIPSPYLAGFFDKFFQNGELPLIETNRGCPFSCTFCQQGEGYYAKVIHFGIDRIREELTYIAEKISDENVEIYGMEIADPNFGMYRRDKEICEILRGIQDNFGYPKSIGCSTGKNRADVIIENVGVLETGSLILRSLPLETKQTHMDGVFELINLGVTEFSCLQTIVLKGTELDLRNISVISVLNEATD